MKLNQVKRAFELCFKSKVTPALVSTSGLGKTSVCKQIGKELGFDTTIILRPSLVADVGDLVGLPDFEVIIEKDGSKTRRTTFNAPDWLPKQGDKSLIVIDEINRTQKDIVMAMFDLIEAEHPKIGQYLLPDGCKVVATLNPPTDNYTVLDFKDSAFTSRLCFLKVVPDMKVFANWGRNNKEVSEEMLQFLAKNDKFFGTGETFEVEDFFGSNEVERGSHIKNNNRSKKKVSDLYTNGKELKVARGVLSECIRGIAGVEFTTAFMQFAEDFKNIITLEDIIKEDDAIERFDYNALSNVSKVLEDLKTGISSKKYATKEMDRIAAFLNKTPLDTFNGFTTFLSNINGEGDENLEFFVDYIENNTDLLTRIEYMVEIGSTEEEDAKEDTVEEAKA